MADTPHAGTDLGRLAQRLAALRAESTGEKSDAPSRTAGHVDAGRRLISLLIVVAAAILGAATGGVVFGYTGEHPVNVIAVLAVFVFLQLLTLMLTGIGMLPAGWRRFVPGLGTLQEAIAAISPGRLAAAAARRLQRPTRTQLTCLAGEWRAHRRALEPVQRWFILASAQTFALTFNAAALLAAVLLVALTDLAFGWATTLDVEASTVRRITSALAAPWAWIAPQAVPAEPLVEQTRYFRLTGVDEAVEPQKLGGWWPFLVLAMLTYGLIPRCAAWAIARWRLAAAVRHADERLQHEQQQLERMRHALQPAAGEPLDADAAPSGRRIDLGSVDLWVVLWAGAPSPFGERDALAAGGGRSTEDDRRAADRIAQTDSARPVLIVTKAWESAQLELFDFVDRVRSGGRRAVWLLPVAVDASGAACDPDEAAWSTWRRTAAGRGDPGLGVLRLGEVRP
ncbi:MAG: DUF2868 domain-containing protein [Alphaproteobacteria bacterium]|jgi:hypothetical protein|nr:DUF2868 domain-containing protein [Alphaproteobacteria bacterium]